MKISPRVYRAIALAARLHDGQRRKVTELPYVVHVFTVAMILMQYTDDEDIIIAGLLHDVLEDVPDCMEECIAEFGNKVVNIVKEVSEDIALKKQKSEHRKNWQQRKDDYLSQLENSSFEAMMVCAADKIQNLGSLINSYEKEGSKVWEKFNAPKAKKLWFYKSVTDILKRRLNSPIVNELEELYNKAINLFK